MFSGTVESPDYFMPSIIRINNMKGEWFRNLTFLDCHWVCHNLIPQQHIPVYFWQKSHLCLCSLFFRFPLPCDSLTRFHLSLPILFILFWTWIPWWSFPLPNLSVLQVVLIATHLRISTLAAQQWLCSPKQLVTVHAQIFIFLHKTPSMLQTQTQNFKARCFWYLRL